MQSYVPAELVTNPNLSFTSPNIEKVRGESKKDLAISNINLGSRPAILCLQGQLTTDGINKSEHDVYGDKYSFGLQFTHQEDRDALVELDHKAEAYLQDQDPDNTYEMRELLKDEILYMKLKPNGQMNGFKVKSNFKLNPKKPNNDIVRWMNIEVKADVGLYINVKDNKAGLYFTVREIDFKQPESDPEMTDVESVAASPEYLTQAPTQQPAAPPNTPTAPRRQSVPANAHSSQRRSARRQ